MNKLSIILLISFLCSGCINYMQKVTLYPDGSGKMTIDYWMKSPDSSIADVVMNVGIFSEDSIRKEFASPKILLENVRVYTDSTDSSTHAEIILSFIHIDSLNSIRPFEDQKFELIDGAAGQKVFSQFIPSISTGFGIDGSAFRVTYIYKVYGDIITHNASKKEAQTLRWDYSLAEIGGGKTISFTFRPFKLKETPYWIFILSGIVLIFVLFFLLKKRKD